MKRKTVLIGIIASVMLCIISIVIITKQEFSTYIILDNEGDAATDEHMIDHLLCKDFAAVSKEDRKVDSYHFSSSETLYKKGGRVYIGEEKKKLVMALPLFMNGGKAVYCYDDGILAITNQFEFVETYQGLYISNGISFNQDMERAYRETFLLLQLNNGTFCNSMELEVSVSALLECVLPQNSIIRFNEDEIRYYSLVDGRFELHSISDLGSSSKIQINDESYGYYDFLEKLGLYSMNDVKEDDEIEESESYQEKRRKKSQ